MPSLPNKVQVHVFQLQGKPFPQDMYQMTQQFLWFFLLALSCYAERNSDLGWGRKTKTTQTWERSIAGFNNFSRVLCLPVPRRWSQLLSLFWDSSYPTGSSLYMHRCPKPRELRLLSNTARPTHYSTTSIIQLFHQPHCNITHTLQISVFPL